MLSADLGSYTFCQVENSILVVCVQQVSRNEIKVVKGFLG